MTSCERGSARAPSHIDRKSTRLNSSHDQISYAVFCLKKKKKNDKNNVEMKPLEKNYNKTENHKISRESLPGTKRAENTLTTPRVAFSRALRQPRTETQ